MSWTRPWLVRVVPHDGGGYDVRAYHRGTDGHITIARVVDAELARACRRLREEHHAAIRAELVRVTRRGLTP